ncbi:MAG: transposase [Acidobacteriia bacterium]|nr:transposase [Terriglobia bacterium]
MAKPHRGPNHEGTFFITANTWERRQNFRADTLAKLLLDVLYDYRRKSRYLLHEFTLMPEHFHLIITPGQQTTLERAVQLIRGGYSYRVGKELNSSLEIWQPGFADHEIRDTRDYATHKTYIWENAVRRKLVEKADEYVHCSAYPGFELDPASEIFRD